jgi:type IV pilus assembly protein PilA
MQPALMPPQPPRPTPPKGFPVWILVLVVGVFGGIAIVGLLAALGIQGVRRYIAAAKTSEAKNAVGAIARSASAAYEKAAAERGKGREALCGSAAPVPVAVPAGAKYVPAAADFDTGTPTEGWKCLRFSIMTPMYYQYHYNRGAHYLSQASAPGPDGFEAAAVGDLDGDGTTSLFARPGKLDGGGALILATQVYIEDERE